MKMRSLLERLENTQPQGELATVETQAAVVYFKHKSTHRTVEHRVKTPSQRLLSCHRINTSSEAEKLLYRVMPHDISGRIPLSNTKDNPEERGLS